MDGAGGASAHKVLGRLADLERKVAEGHWELRPDTMTIVLRHTAGILAALHSAVVADVMASS
jgi:hypothetical protein